MTQTHSMTPQLTRGLTRRDRIENALWGLFIADALAMPAHWYYNRASLRAVFGAAGVRAYAAAPHPHPESFMVGSRYAPDVANAKALGRPYDILHAHARFYDTPYSDLAIDRDAREPEHGNRAPAEAERYHYHHGLGAGENTLNAHLARVLLRQVRDDGAYDPEAYLAGMIAHMTTPGRNEDPYVEVFLRRWFENYASGLPAALCAADQRSVWSIGSHGGMHRAMIVSMLAPDAYLGVGLGLEHQALTHRSEMVSGAVAHLTPTLHQLLGGADLGGALTAAAAAMRPPRTGGGALFARYRAAKGPGNIPKPEMWRLHMDLSAAPIDLQALTALGDDAVLDERLGTACYPEQGAPVMIYCAAAADFDFTETLLRNVNAGGDNVGRALPLGLLMGAGAAAVPEALKRGLRDHDALAEEIASFAAIAVSGDGF